MIAEHVGKQSTTVRRALKAAKVALVRPPGVQGLRVTEQDANELIQKHWPEAGPMFVRVQSIPTSRFTNLEDDVSFLRRIVDALQKNDTGYVIALERMKAQNEALRSMLNEILRETGMSRETCDQHFVARSNHYLDRILCDAELNSPMLSAMLDDRDPDEIPTEKGFPPLFPKSRQ